VLFRSLGWVEDRAADPAFSCRGRTAASVARDVEAWRALRDADPVRRGRSGLRGLRDGEVVVRELLSERELVAEGQRMGHCVAMYRPLVASGKVAVFAVEGGAHAATVEVLPALGVVVQVKGPHNRAPSAPVRDLVRRWASSNHLTLRV
jgi:hypothetical protein